MTDDATRLWSVQDVAAFLGISVQTLYHYRAGRAPDGFPRGYRIGGSAVRYDPDEIRAWVRQQRDPAPAA